MGIWLLMSVSVLVLIGVIGGLLFGLLVRQGARDRAQEDAGLGPESRSLFLPTRRVVQEIEAFVHSHRDSPAVHVIGTEAVFEAKRILGEVHDLLKVRSNLRKMLRGRAASEQETALLEMNLENAQSIAERETLQAALAARQTELSHLGTIEDQVARIDAAHKQAQAALAEMKSRLQVAAADAQLDASGDRSLRDSIGRLKALNVSFDEVKELVR